ncbi:MAG: tyrosine-type recombinase/integrase [Victivallaceae bacterium]
MGRPSSTEKPKKIKLATGTVYQKIPGGNFFFRYQVDRERKAVSLKTKVEKDALKKAESYLPIINASNAEVISAHVKEAKGWAARKKLLLLEDIWGEYSRHPNRATPATVHEQKSYESTLNEFIGFINSPGGAIREISSADADRFSQYLRETGISVSTHNRKIKRLRKIFDTLKDFCDSNPFVLSILKRKPREEQEQQIRRLAFSREQEQAILTALDDPSHKLKNKQEIKTIYYLGLYTGQRLKDCVLLKWDHIDLERQRIWIKQFKTGKEVSIPLAAPLLKELQVAYLRKENDYVSPSVAERYKQVDKNGKTVGDNLVNVDIMRVLRWAGIETSAKMEGRVRKVTVYGFHSLRHSFVSHCAEAGVPKAVVQSIIGAEGSIIDKYYTHVGEDAQLAAIEAISGSAGRLSDRERIQQVLAYISTLAEPSSEVSHICQILLAKN